MKNLKIIFIIIIVLLVIFGAFYIYINDKSKTVFDNNENNQPVACTMDAKQCPDGNYVGRTGPNCEFVCPVFNSDNTSDWNVYINSKYNYKFKYPKIVQIYNEQEADSDPIYESSRIKSFIPGNSENKLDVFVWLGTLSAHEAVNTDRGDTIKRLGLYYQGNDVGSIEEIMFANQVAYSYKIKNELEDGDHTNYTVIFIEHNGYAIKILYKGKLMRDIVKTFETIE